MIVLILLLTIILALIYYYLSWNFDYWRKQGIASPKGTRIILGDLPNAFLRKQNIFYDIEKIYK